MELSAMKPYRTVSAASETEYVVNRSRFIGRCFPVTDEQEALAILERIRKQHWDALRTVCGAAPHATATTASRRVRRDFR